MRKRILLLGFVLCTAFSVSAQSDFRKGYIITNDNDTIHGLIDYRGDIKNCSQCIFKLEETDKPIEYLADDIKGYRFIDSKYYISYYLDDLAERVFIEYLIDGIVDIYYYKDNFKENYYASKNGSELYKLDNEVIEIKVDDKIYAKNSNKYISILRYLYSDSSIPLDKVNTLRLGHKPLIDISHEYHNNVCNGDECIIFEKKLPPVRVEFSVLLLSDFSNVDFSNVEFSEKLNVFEKYSYGIDVGYSLGIGMSTYLPRLNERISVYFQLLYSNNNFNSSVITEDDFYKYYNYSKMSFNYLNSFIGFKYVFPKGKIRPEFLLGLVKNFMISTKDEQIIDQEVSDGVIKTYVYNDELSLNYSGAALGLGLNFYELKKVMFNISLQYNFMYNDFFGEVNTTASKYNSLKIGLGIKF